MHSNAAVVDVNETPRDGVNDDHINMFNNRGIIAKLWSTDFHFFFFFLFGQVWKHREISYGYIYNNLNFFFYPPAQNFLYP